MLLAGVLAAAVATAAFLSGGLASLELKSIDARFSLRATEPPNDIVIVAVDDVSFSDLRMQWPFPRTAHAKVTDELRKAKAGQIVFDIQFTEESERVEDDLALFEALGKGRRRRARHERERRPGPHAGPRRRREPAPDQQRRRVEHAARRGRGRRPALHARQRRPAHARRRGRRARRQADRQGRLRPRRHRLDRLPRPAARVPDRSFSDVHEGRVDPKFFEGKIVVVGASAPTLQDVIPTPTSKSLMAGPEIQANAIWTGPARPAAARRAAR
jgi:adenylate cyclase